MLVRGFVPVTVAVLYWMPDHRSILNEFVWQTLDISPRYPRVERFLDHWRREIEATIAEVRLSAGGALVRDWRGISDLRMSH